MKLSIIIPVYNAEKYLNFLLDSIIKQIKNEVEIILINDGSTDNSLNICNDYSKEYPYIIVKSIENSGSGIARNTGIRIANGEYLYFPDSDDLVCDNSIDTILDSLKDNPDYIVYSYFQKYRNDDKCQVIKIKDATIYGDEIRYNYEKCLIPSSDFYLQGAPWNKVFKKSIIEKNNLEFPSLKRHQDDAFIINYVGYANKIKLISKPIYIYFLNMSSDEALKFPKNYFEIRKQVYEIFIENLNNWNSSEISKQYVAFSFALCLKRIFMLTYSEKWNMNAKERDKYFSKVFNDNTTREIMVSIKNSYNKVISIIPNLSRKKRLMYKFYIKQIIKRRKRVLKIVSFMLYKFGNNKFLLRIKK